MEHSKNELKLIEAVKINNDDIALQKLFNNYRPLVEKSKKQFYVKDFDEADWDQEAFIIFHQAILKFNPKRGKFCTFFKQKLYNHHVSVLRYKKAGRREGDESCVSLEALEEVNSTLIKEKSGSMMAIEDVAIRFLDVLSLTELMAFKIDLGKENIEDVMKKHGWDKEKIIRAHARAYKKFINTIFEK